MISSTLDRTATQTNATATETRIMGIHAEALAAVTDSMTNLYHDPNLAVLREYSTNARDAILAAGSGSPVRVSLPDSLDPRLVVVDDGIGMSKDEVLTFFSQYGASNKRDVNTQIGSFGFGCKAAFAIADQFVVTAVRDGHRTVALFARNSDGVGTASIMSHTPTDDGNGVTVAVPVNDADAMTRAADDLFATWEPGSVLVDGEPPRTVIGTGIVIGDVRLVTDDGPNRSRGGLFVVMGGVAYEVDQDLAHSAWKALGPWYATSVRTYIAADIGDVDIVPSREGLRATNRTTAFLGRVRREFDAAELGHVQSMIDDAATWFEAAMVLRRCAAVPCVAARRVLFFWRGQLLDVMTKLDVPVLRLNDKSTRILSQSENSDSTVAVGATHLLAITGVTAANELGVRHGLRALMLRDGFTAVVLCPDATYTHEWFTLRHPGVTVMTVAESKSARTAALRALSGDRAPTGPVSYDVFTPGFGVTRRSLAELRALPTVAFTRRSAREVGENLSAMGCDTPVVCLSTRQALGTLRRRLPGVRDLSDLVQEWVAAQVAGFTAADLPLIAADRNATRRSIGDERIAKMLRPRLGDITNPDVVALVHAATQKVAAPSEPTRRFQRVAATAMLRQSPACASFLSTVDAANSGGLLERYPLLDTVRYGNITDLTLSHVVAYLNAVSGIPAV